MNIKEDMHLVKPVIDQSKERSMFLAQQKILDMLRVGMIPLNIPVQEQQESYNKMIMIVLMVKLLVQY